MKISSETKSNLSWKLRRISACSTFSQCFGIWSIFEGHLAKSVLNGMYCFSFRLSGMAGVAD